MDKLDNSNFVKISIDTFQYNAGIIGFLNTMFINHVDSGDDTFYTEGQFLFINKDFLNTADFADMYITALIDKFGDGSIVTQMLNTDFETCDEKLLKNFDNFCKRKTLANICVLVGRDDLKTTAIQYHKEKDKDQKRVYGKKLVDILKFDENAYKHVLIGDIALMKMSYVFRSFAFLKYNQGNYNIVAKKSFYEQLNEEVFDGIRNLDDDFKEKAICIQCGRAIERRDIKMTFIRDCIADMSKKNSVFWDKFADTYVCPICKFIYAFMPLGFNDLGRILVFANSNDTIEILKKTNITIKMNEDDKNPYYVAYNTILQRVLELKLNELNNIQIIIKDSDNRYSVKTIGRDKLKTILKVRPELKGLSKTYVKIGTDFLDVYRQCVDNIINGKNQYGLINQLLRQEYKLNYQVYCLIKIQIYKNYFCKEDSMDALFKKACVVKNYGSKLRKEFGFDADNKLNGFVYQLLNAVQSGNVDLFHDRIIRMYVSIQKPIPNIFISNYKGDEEFKTLGYAYILGLKGEDYKKEEDNNGGNN